MSNADERMQILKMVEAGKLSASEAAKLLEAMEAAPQAKNAIKYVRIRVQEHGKKETNVRMPIGLASFLFNLIPDISVEDGNGSVRTYSMRQIEQAIKAGQTGRVVEVEHEGGRVDIFLE